MKPVCLALGLVGLTAVAADVPYGNPMPTGATGRWAVAAASPVADEFDGSQTSAAFFAGGQWDDLLTPDWTGTFPGLFRKELVSVQSGSLHLGAEVNGDFNGFTEVEDCDCGFSQVTTSMVASSGRLAPPAQGSVGTYVEVKATVPAGTNLLSAIFMQSETGEVSFAELVASPGKQSRSNYHCWGDGGDISPDPIAFASAGADGAPHRYGVYWSEAGELEYFVDGVPHAKVTAADASCMNAAMNLVISVELHTEELGDPDFSQMPGGLAETKVDYIRHWNVDTSDPPTEPPTKAPTDQPTKAPTKAPTDQPTKAPTKAPTDQPTKAPTKAPTNPPTVPPTDPAGPTCTAPARFHYLADIQSTVCVNQCDHHKSENGWKDTGYNGNLDTCGATSKVAVDNTCTEVKKLQTFAEAERLCEDAGAYLCSVAELEARVTQGTGCSLDGKFVWTRDPLGSNGCGANQRIQALGKPGSEDPKCVSPTSTARVRCCAPRVASQCTCANGVAAAGCQDSPAEKCSSCVSGYELVDGVCAKASNPCSGTGTLPHLLRDIGQNVCVLSCAAQKSSNGWTTNRFINAHQDTCGATKRIGSDANCAEVENPVTFEAAEQICAAESAYLCSAQELEGDAARGTGCGHDNRYIWTRDLPSNSNGCSAGERIQNPGKSGAGEKTRRCAAPSIATGYVRCCAPKAPSTLQTGQVQRQPAAAGAYPGGLELGSGSYGSGSLEQPSHDEGTAATTRAARMSTENLERAEKNDDETDDGGLSPGAIAAIAIVVAALLVAVVIAVALQRKQRDAAATAALKVSQGRRHSFEMIAKAVEDATFATAELQSRAVTTEPFEENAFVLDDSGSSVRLKSVRRSNPMHPEIEVTTAGVDTTSRS